MQRIQILLALTLTISVSLTLLIVPTALAARTAPIQSAKQVISTPIPISTLSEQPAPEPVTRGRPPLALTLFLLGFCCFFLLLVGVFVLGIFVRRQNYKKDKN